MMHSFHQNFVSYAIQKDQLLLDALDYQTIGYGDLSSRFRPEKMEWRWLRKSTSEILFIHMSVTPAVATGMYKVALRCAFEIDTKVLSLTGDVSYPDDCIKILRSRPFWFSARSCNKWALDRVLLCGDSAHVFPPCEF